MSSDMVVPEISTETKTLNESNISIRQLAKLLKKLHVQSGDILVVKYQSSIAEHRIIDKIILAMEHLKINVMVVVAEDFEDLTVLNEQEMNKRGWFRFDKLSRVMHIPKGDVKKQ